MIWFIVLLVFMAFGIFYSMALFEEIEKELYNAKTENEDLKRKLLAALREP